MLFFFFFFFQAEDGIRDTSVTGVQTCALPILLTYKVLLKRYIAEVGFRNFREKVAQDGRFFRSVAVLEEPGVMLTKTPRIPGLDGRKMSKSYGNAITLSESDADIRAKTKVMMTDPARKRRSDPGNRDVCPVYDWQQRA